MCVCVQTLRGGWVRCLHAIHEPHAQARTHTHGLLPACVLLRCLTLHTPRAPPQLYLSQEQAKAVQGNNSQGPVYKPYAAIGPQPESKYATAPVSGFGTSARQAKNKGGNYPGPGALRARVALMRAG